MRAAATVGRLMPSPRKRMTLRAWPAIAPLPAARAAPARYHQAAVSPSGWATVGTSMTCTAVGAGAGACVAHAARKEAQVARAKARMRSGNVEGPQMITARTLRNNAALRIAAHRCSAHAVEHGASGAYGRPFVFPAWRV